MRLSEEEVTYEIDSAGNELEVITQTHISEIAMCDCLVGFSYQFSMNLNNVQWLNFHGRTFPIAEIKER